MKVRKKLNIIGRKKPLQLIGCDVWGWEEVKEEAALDREVWAKDLQTTCCKLLASQKPETCKHASVSSVLYICISTYNWLYYPTAKDMHQILHLHVNFFWTRTNAKDLQRFTEYCNSGISQFYEPTPSEAGNLSTQGFLTQHNYLHIFARQVKERLSLRACIGPLLDWNQKKANMSKVLSPQWWDSP